MIISDIPTWRFFTWISFIVFLYALFFNHAAAGFVSIEVILCIGIASILTKLDERN